ncbi:MAG: isochorismate synthase [Phocaeicola sp.]|nr:isochorismate synthase [Phocaeicola sp.]
MADSIDKIGSWAIYRKPHEKEVHILSLGKVEKYTSLSMLKDKTGFVMAPFLPTDVYPICLYPIVDIQNSWETAAQIANNIDIGSFGNTSTSGKESKEEYGLIFDACIEALNTHTLQKVVLSSRRTLPYAIEVWESYKRACDTFDAMYISLLCLEDCGVWIGASPELLLSIDGDQGRTVALAGTQERYTQESSTWDKKNIREQALVSSYIENVLSAYATDVQHSEPYTATAGKLQHRKTDFNFRLNAMNRIGELLESLHPTPAVCGLPKEKALSFITSHEYYDRGYYTGFLGVLNRQGKTELYVNLRCMQLFADKTQLYGGSGLLPTSDKESEWIEINKKMDTLGSIIQPLKKANVHR